MEFIKALLSGSVGAGLMAIIMAALQRHWKKKDDKEGAIAALVEAQKVLMIDRVRHLGNRYIADKSISLDDKETLQEMFMSYRKLGGNGHLDTIMAEVNKLPIRSDDHD